VESYEAEKVVSGLGSVRWEIGKKDGSRTNKQEKRWAWKERFDGPKRGEVFLDCIELEAGGHSVVALEELALDVRSKDGSGKANERGSARGWTWEWMGDDSEEDNWAAYEA
jgi:hypothetical protein